jgi:hypothetical protein
VFRDSGGGVVGLGKTGEAKLCLACNRLQG